MSQEHPLIQAARQAGLCLFFNRRPVHLLPLSAFFGSLHVAQIVFKIGAAFILTKG